MKQFCVNSRHSPNRNCLLIDQYFINVAPVELTCAQRRTCTIRETQFHFKAVFSSLTFDVFDRQLQTVYIRSTLQRF